MNGFLRSFILGLALLFVVVGSAVVALGMSAQGDIRRAIRAWVLSEDEQSILLEEGQKPAAPMYMRDLPEATRDDIIEELAERVTNKQVQDLMVRLKAQSQQLEERRSFLDQRNAELQVAEADITRRLQELHDVRQQVQQEIDEADAARVRYMKDVSVLKNDIIVFDEVARKGYIRQAKLFEQLGKSAWESLRRFSPDEIAKYLVLMDTKKTAEVIKQAQKDVEYPDMAYEIHKAMLRVDMDGISGDRVQQLATVYSYLPQAEVASILLQAKSVKNASRILKQLQIVNNKKAALVQSELQRLDSAFEKNVLQEMSSDDAEGGAL